MAVSAISSLSLVSAVSTAMSAHQDRAAQSIERLATGRRLVATAGGERDTVAISMAARFQARLNGLDAAEMNVQMARSLVDTADAAMGQQSELLQRIRELAVKAASDTLTDTDRTSISDEIEGLSVELDRIGAQTDFNSKKLLAGGSLASDGMTFLIGATQSETLNLKLDTVTATALGVLTTQLSVDSAANASATIAQVDAAIASLAGFRGNVGSIGNRLDVAANTLAADVQASTRSLSAIEDTDMAKETAELAKAQVMQQAAVAMLAQANSFGSNVLALLR